MAKVPFKFKLNRKGVREMLKSPEVQSMLVEHASAMASRAGEGYGYDSYVGKTRANASVYASSQDARYDNLNNNTLLKSVR